MLAYTLIVIPAAEIPEGLLIRENSLVVDVSRRACGRNYNGVLYRLWNCIIGLLVHAVVHIRIRGDDDSSRAYTQP